MRNQTTVLGSGLITANRSDNHSIRSRAAAGEDPAGQDREFQERGGAGEQETLIVVILVRVAA